MEKAILLILIVFVVKSHSAPDQTYQAPILQSKNEEQQIVDNNNNNNNNYHKAADNLNVAHDPAIYSTFIPQDAVQQYVSQYGSGYAGQVEGFLIPAYERNQPVVTPTFISFIRTILPAPKIIFALIVKVITLVATAAGVLFFGALLCTFTTVCTTLPQVALLRKETKEIVDKIGQELTAERIKRAADLFTLAFNKYQEMQKMAEPLN